MTALTILPSKISKTKKRLSNNTWYLPIMVLALMVLLTFLSSALRAVSLPGSFGILEAELPVILEGRTSTPDQPWTTAEAVLDDQSPVVLLTASRFYFGTLKAFGKDLSAVNNKYLIPHDEGAPNLPVLVEQLGKWKKEAGAGSILVLVPTSEIPTPIVLQVFAELQKSGLFEKIVLGGGLL